MSTPKKESESIVKLEVTRKGIYFRARRPTRRAVILFLLFLLLIIIGLIALSQQAFRAKALQTFFSVLNIIIAFYKGADN